MGYDDAEYLRPELLWTQRNFIQPQTMAEERYFYDPAAGKYTVGRYLDDLDKRYGGVDSILIWPVYPNIGIDNRNQWDLARDLPGGISGLRRMVEDFHRGTPERATWGSRIGARLPSSWPRSAQTA